MTSLLFLSVLASSPALAGDAPKLFPAHEQGRFGFINKKGRFKIEPTYDEARAFSEGLAAVRVGDLWGYIDEKGRWLVSPTYTDAMNFSEGYAAVQQGQKVGFINSDGTLVVPPTRTNVGNLKSGRALIVEGEAYGYIDATGAVVIPATLPWAEAFADGLAPVSISGQKAGFMALDGTLAIAEKYVKVGRPSEGLIAVSLDGEAYSYVDYSGEVVLPGPYGGAADFVEGRAWVLVDDRHVLINTKGVEVPTPEHTERGPFSSGLAAVRVDSGLAFLTLDGELVLDGGYVDALGFQGPLGLVQRDFEWSYITRKGKVVWSDALPAVSDGARAAAEELVGKGILKGSHWLGENSKFTASELVGVVPDLQVAVDFARVRPGWEVVTVHTVDSVPYYALYAVGSAEIYREYTLTSDVLDGWIVVEPDQTAEDSFRSVFGRETATRQVDRAIDAYVASEPESSALNNIPELHGGGSLQGAPIPASLDVHLVRAALLKN